MIKKILISSCLLLNSWLVCADDQIVFEQMLSQTQDQSALGTLISVERMFANINVVTVKLNTLGISATIKDHNQNEIYNVMIHSNGTISDFITLAAAKFNYAVLINGNKVVFEAKNPIPNSQATIPVVATKPISVMTQQAWTLAPTDKTLRNTLTKWAKLAGWQLIWNVRADYPVTTLWTIQGSFESAVNEVLKASQATDIPLMATMHDSNHVLEIYTVTTIQ